MTPEPLTLGNKTGNGVPAMADLIAVQAYLDSRLTLQSQDMGRRFAQADKRQAARLEQVSVQVNGRLDGVCADVDTLKLERSNAKAVAEALHGVAVETAAAAGAHTLSFRWRVTVAISAVSGTCAAIGTMIVLLRIAAVGHL